MSIVTKENNPELYNALFQEEKSAKEILDKLEIVARKHTIEVFEDGGKIETMSASVVDELRLNNYSAKLLLDYITNLQENYERIYNENCKLREERNITDVSLLDENYNLRQENEKLKEMIKESEIE